MKRIVTVIYSFLIFSGLTAQVPDKMSYQAVVRNNSDALVTNTDVGMQISILQGTTNGTEVYIETQNPSTNVNGLVSIVIGEGTVISGDFAGIDWSQGPYFLKTEIDPAGGTDYTITGTSQLLSVPYAIHARTADSLTGSMTETDPVFASSASAGITGSDITSWNNKPNSFTEIDGDISNEIQSLRVSETGDTLYLSGANWIIIPGISLVQSAGGSLEPLHNPVLEVQFDENPVTHNMHITSDGKFYYTINGGSASSGQINKFDLEGNFVSTFPIAIDGRGLSFNKADGYLYASVYGGSIIKITNLAAGEFTTISTVSMQSNQASFALSPDGTKLYDFNDGTLNIYSFPSGSLISTLTGLNTGSDARSAAVVGADPDYIYTWDASTGTVYVYDHSGAFQRDMNLPLGNYGYSLSIVDGYLFVSVDNNNSTGSWYGYNIRKSVDLKKGAVIAISPENKTPDTRELPEFDTTRK